jgi:hypothetical protein
LKSLHSFYVAMTLPGTWLEISFTLRTQARCHAKWIFAEAVAPTELQLCF